MPPQYKGGMDLALIQEAFTDRVQMCMLKQPHVRLQWLAEQSHILAEQYQLCVTSRREHNSLSIGAK